MRKAQESQGTEARGSLTAWTGLWFGEVIIHRWQFNGIFLLVLGSMFPLQEDAVIFRCMLLYTQLWPSQVSSSSCLWRQLSREITHREGGGGAASFLSLVERWDGGWKNAARCDGIRVSRKTPTWSPETTLTIYWLYVCYWAGVRFCGPKFLPLLEGNINVCNTVLVRTLSE